MSKQKILIIGAVLIITMILVYYRSSQGTKQATNNPNATMINIYGKTDERLKLKFISVYRPISDSSNPDCKRHLDINTRAMRVPLKANAVYLENQDEYNVTIPIYNKDLTSKCLYEFLGISVKIKRIGENNEKYARVPIVSARPQYIGEGMKGGFSRYYRPTHTKRYFRMPNGKQVSCYTEYYERTSDASFICDLDFRGEVEGVDEIQNDSIHFDIIIDEEKCIYLPKFSRKVKKRITEDNFRMPDSQIFNTITNLFKGD